MPAPTTREHAIADGEDVVDALFRPLASRVRQVVRAHGETPLTPLDRVRIMREVDTALVGIFGRYPGDPGAPLAGAVVESCQRVRQRVWTDAGRVLRQHVRRDPPLLRALTGR